MPELPEVETIVRELSVSNLIGCQIRAVHIFWARTIGDLSIEDFSQLLIGQKFLAVSRKGKWIEFTLEHAQLYVHLRMTGKFFFGKPTEKPHLHERVRLLLDDNRCLRFEDQRKFGRWKLIREGEKGISNIGIDPLSLQYTYPAFKKLLQGRKQTLKSFLLNQKYLAGLGNIYVDESLWEAKLHPLRRTNDLTAKEMTALFKAIPLVLQKGVDNTGTTLGNTKANYYSVSGRSGDNQHHLNVFRRHGLACPSCGSTIVRSVVAQRGTHFCPSCQK